MGLWQTVWIIVGAIGVVGIAAFAIPGVSDIISVIVSFFGHIFNFMLSATPKPLRAILFIVLFSSAGIFVVNFLIGTQYVCVDDTVYHVPLVYGLAVQSWIDLRGAPIELKIEDDADVSNSTTWKIVNVNGTSVAYGLTTMNELTKYDAKTMLRSMPVEQFNNMFFGLGGKLGIPDQYVIYNICYNPDDGSCLIYRQKGSTSECAFGLLSNPTGAWKYDVGELRYQYFEGDESNTKISLFSNKTRQDVLKVKYNSRRPALSGYLGGIIPFLNENSESFYDLNDCGETKGLLSGYNYVDWSFTEDPAFNTKKTFNARIYNGAMSPIFVTDVQSGAVLGDDGDKRLFFKASKEYFMNFLSDLHISGEKVDNTGGLIKFECNKDTPESFDTKMTFLNMDVFSMEFIVFLFVVLGVLAVWKFWSGFY